MKMIVVFKFRALDESIKQIAMEVAREFPGVTKVVDVEGEGQLEVRGEFSTFELTKELKKIDESFESIKIGPDVVTEPEVKPHQQDEGKRPINIQEPSKPPNVDASSSKWKGLRDAAEQAKVVGFSAAEKAKGIGTVAGLAAEQAKVMGVAAAEKAKAIHGGAVKYLEKRKRQEKDRLRNEWLKEEDLRQRKIIQENKKKWQEKDKMMEQDLEKKSEGGTTLGSMTTGFWKSTSTLLTGQTSAFMQSIRTGQTSASTQDQGLSQTRKKESQPVEKKGKNGKYYPYYEKKG